MKMFIFILVGACRTNTGRHSCSNYFRTELVVEYAAEKEYVKVKSSLKGTTKEEETSTSSDELEM